MFRTILKGNIHVEEQTTIDRQTDSRKERKPLLPQLPYPSRIRL